MPRLTLLLGASCVLLLAARAGRAAGEQGQALGVPAQQAYLKASNTGANDRFGWSVAASGDTLVVGAYVEASSASGVNGDQTSNAAPGAGAAYVFRRGAASGWSQEAYLKASNTDPGDGFGYSVAISGNTLVIGALTEASTSSGVNGNQSSNSAPSAGAAYVFVREGTSWSQQAYLKASNTGASDQFGASVSISGDTLVVGARGEDSDATGVNGDQANNNRFESGAAYVFVRNGTTWSQEAYLKASNAGSTDNFGFSVAIAGDTLVIGAQGEDSNASGVNGDQNSNSAGNAGAAYVFARSGTSWSQQAYLKAASSGTADLFGWTVAVAGDTVVVGAHLEDSNASGVNGDPTDNSRADSGAAYVFRRGATGWSPEAYLKASNTGVNDHFGYAVSLSSEALLIGARFEASAATGVNGDETSNSAPTSGAAYLFVRDGSAWSQSAYLKASNTEAADNFGQAVAVSDNDALVGAWSEDSGATGVNGDESDNSTPLSGAAYAFTLHPPLVVFRNAGTNPASYTASLTVIGGTFTASVDNNLAGKTTSFLFAFDTPSSFPLSNGQTLLCFDLGSGELFTGGNLFPSASAAGVDSFSLPVPSNPALIGGVLHSQAIQYGGPPFVLSNAQDITIGAF